MIDVIVKSADWLQEKIKTKSGIFIFGIIIGAIPSGFMMYTMKDSLNDKDKIIENWQVREDRIISEKNQWQERAFNSEQACLERLKEMAHFFNDLETFYKKEEEARREQLIFERQKLNKYESISSQLNVIKKDLKNEN